MSTESNFEKLDTPKFIVEARRNVTARAPTRIYTLTGAKLNSK